ncbi:HAD hydrolase-like protein [Paracraurococcus lichenis]|uniref:HAD hydrolase-like protein n=1 Tax=Paracraurococcus lichenis TaxID=3064888 RepID=A0ABT9DZR5_9PROT|nr:HAD hydrolase-like protein [Paracraurococcus sp. LOR1-02]MDO9709396.1 HAD hydrolase-like protein [Paracraurococcus sp. LOR1-02]
MPPAPPPRLVIFDFDGTLADSFPWFRSVLNEVGARHGLRPVAPEEVESLRLLPTPEILRAMQVPPWKLPALTRDLRAMKAEAAACIPLFPGVPEMLRGLAAGGAVVAIASSDAEPNIRRTLGAAAAAVSHFACGASLFGKAPKLRQVLRATGLPAAAAVYVGDETRDAEAAAKVGMDFAAVTWGYAAPAALLARGPRWVFGTPAEVAAGLGM